MSKRNEIEVFEQEKKNNIDQISKDCNLKKASLDWIIKSDKYKYSYNFTWMGIPIIKFPNDILAFQEIIWGVKPDLIIETGIAHGGSILFSASMLELVGKGEVLGIDIDIRKHNRERIEAHPMYKRIDMIEGSSISEETFSKVKSKANQANAVMVFLDSNHTHEHVYQELLFYSQLVSKGSYLVVADTFVEFLPKGYCKDRPWDVGNNPYTAMQQFLSENDQFVVDTDINNKLLITETVSGILKKVKD